MGLAYFFILIVTMVLVINFSIYYYESFHSLTDPNYLQNQGSRLDTIVEMETKEQLKPPFIKRILVVDDDSDITLTFKVGLDGHYYGNGDKKKTLLDEMLEVAEEKQRTV